MSLVCPACGDAVSQEQINMATDVAVCSGCNHVFSVSRQVRGDSSPLPSPVGFTGTPSTEIPNSFDIDSPPAGVTYENRGASGWKIRASTRSMAALFLVPFTCAWSGFSMAGIYGSQIVSGEFNLIMSLFGLPFLVGTIVLVSVCAMSLFGHIAVTCQGNESSIFTGLGSIGWRRPIDWDTVNCVEETYHNNSSSLALVGQSRTVFGTFLSADRRYYIKQALQTLIEERRARR